MAESYYDSDLTGEELDAALHKVPQIEGWTQEAKASATAAAASQTAAKASENEAASSKTAAANSASAAANSQKAAATSAANAKSSETAAASSKSAAAASASQASASAANAQESKTAAASSAQAAAASAQTARQAAQEALGFRTFFGAVTPDDNGSFDPSRPMTTAGVASVTVQSKGDRIQSVEVNGFTSDGQNGGLRMVVFVLDGSKNWTSSTTSTSGKYRWALSAADMGISLDAPSTNNDVAPIFSNIFAAVTANSTLNLSAGIAVDISGNLRVYDPECDASLTDWKAKLNKNPLFIWAIPADESQATGLYIPVELQGHEYRCRCLELTAPLCKGDRVESHMPSGCDQTLVLDGSSDENWFSVGSNGNYQCLGLRGAAPTNNAEVASVLSESLSPASANNAYLGRIGIAVNDKGDFTVTLPDKANPHEYFAQHPLRVYFRSTAYAEKDDIPVQLETHADGSAYARPAVELAAVPYTDADSERMPGTYTVGSQDGTTLAVSLKAFQDGGDAATLNGKTAEEIRNATFIEVQSDTAGTLLALIVGNAVPGYFTVSTTGNYSDLPASAVGGFSSNGMFFPASNSVQDYGVFLWQQRNTDPAKYGRVWYRAIKDGAWNNEWKLLSAETDAKAVAAAVYEEMAAAYNEGVMSV